MKLKSFAAKCREKRLCLKRTRKAQRRAYFQLMRRRSLTVVIPSRYAGTPTTLIAPEHFELYTDNNRARVLVFLRELRHLTLGKRQSVRIDFSKTQTMVACGTLLFAAELNRIVKTVSPLRLVTCTYPKNNKIEQILDQVGIFALLGKAAREKPTASDVVCWQFIDGNMAEGEKAHNLIALLTDKLPAAISRDLYDGLVEAMTNCVHHAYIAPREDGYGRANERGWWMFSKEQDGELSIVFCDLGLGIPRTLNQTQDLTALETMLKKVSQLVGIRGKRDCDMIHAAIELRRSRLAKEHRGLGLLEMLDVVNTTTNGYLRIFSNYGCYSYRKFKDGIETKREYKRSIYGTLIQWKVPISATSTSS